ncbi:MAG TPA: YhjD/YihY/BrkB family envelope integrity protein [Gammaproteobacteria bacterium]|nr:YhjD/YihY/BrkB family envelope integrity protein [Gammaproteobacteria bacterium]
MLQFLRRRLWPEQEPEKPLPRYAVAIARYLYALVRELSTGEINLRAMSLVYTTALSVVPMLGFAFAIAKGLGIHRQMEPLLRRFMQPIGPRADEFTQTIISFVDNVSSGLLAVIAVGLLMLTVMSMAKKVESSFNFVWRVDRPRSFGRRFTEYLSVILIGPTIMLVAAGLIASFSSEALVERLSAGQTIGALIMRIGDALPYLLVVCAFTFLYLFIPNTTVRLRPALIGGLVAGIVWTGSGYLFAGVVATSARLEAIYSGFVVVFVAMIWLYLTWLIFLLGSQLAYYVQYPFQLRHGRRTAPIGNSSSERLCLSIMYMVASDFARPGHGWTDESLAAALRVPRSTLEPIIAGLLNARLLSKDSEHRLIPGRDPHRIMLTDVIATMRGGDGEFQSRDTWNETIDHIADRIDDAITNELGGGSLGELVDESLPEEAS